MQSGVEVSPFYDSMIAKIIGHGETREEARRKLLCGLEDAVALGVTTNQRFLSRCLAHPAFVRGAATTAFIDQHLGELLHRDAESEARAVALAALLLLETADGATPRMAGRRLPHSLPINLRFDLDEAGQVVSLSPLGQRRYGAEIAGRRFELDLAEIGAHFVHFDCDGVSEGAVYWREGARLLLRYRGQSYEIRDRTRATSARRDSAATSDGKLRASMNGRIVAVGVAIGERVEAGQAVVTLEAMKMQHIHSAPVAGTIKVLNVAVGDQVSAHRVVAEIEPAAPLSAA